MSIIMNFIMVVLGAIGLITPFPKTIFVSE